ncbi:MAG: DUF3467 domain-containing protein [Pseudomonadota bacterium]
MNTEPEEIAPPAVRIEGRYANAFQVGHNAFEFVVDFSQQYAGSLEAPTHTRIVTSPHFAKALLETLRTSIAEYETEFGEIEDAG